MRAPKYALVVDVDPVGHRHQQWRVVGLYQKPIEVAEGTMTVDGGGGCMHAIMATPTMQIGDVIAAGDMRHVPRSVRDTVHRYQLRVMGGGAN